MAFRTPTVFVIGAGASCELGFPSGPKLLKDVAKALNFRFDPVGRQVSGDERLLSAIKFHHAAKNLAQDMNAYGKAAQRLHGASNIARSIDNAIDQNDDNPLVPIVGKLAIANEILQAESKSKLFVKDHPDPTPSVDAVRETWLFYLAQMLSTDLKKADAPSAFDQVSFITFNYDRSLEFFLPSVFVEAYGIEIAQAREIAKTAQIFHPYGQVGQLPWMSQGSGSIQYGEIPHVNIVEISSGLQTFNESQRPDHDLAEMQKVLIEASRIVFIGFGYHRQNMRLLQPDNSLNAERVYGTVYEEPVPAIEQARAAIRSLLSVGLNPQLGIEPSLANMTCAEFMRQHFSPLTA